MVTIFFFGVDLKLSGLKAIPAFKDAEVLSEKGKEAKIGFKKGEKQILVWLWFPLRMEIIM